MRLKPYAFDELERYTICPEPPDENTTWLNAARYTTGRNEVIPWNLMKGPIYEPIEKIYSVMDVIDVDLGKGPGDMPAMIKGMMYTRVGLECQIYHDESGDPAVSSAHETLHLSPRKAILT